MSRGPIEAKPALTMIAAGELFPRLMSRGPIEA